MGLWMGWGTGAGGRLLNDFMLFEEEENRKV